MDIERLQMVIIFVADVEESVRWYEDVLEMTLLSHHGEFATLRAGESQIGLHGGAGPGAEPRNVGAMPVFKVEAYEAAKATLEARGCQFVFEDSTPVSRFGTFLDPDGNQLQIMASRQAA